MQDLICELPPKAVAKLAKGDALLFHQDRLRLKSSKLFLLFPATCVETHEFINSFSAPPNVLGNAASVETFEHVNAQLGYMKDETETEVRRARFASISANLLHPHEPATLTQKSFSIQNLEQVLVHCQGKRDHYLSQNSFTYRRIQDCVRQLTSCWVDLDYYKPSIDVSTDTVDLLNDDQEAISLILERCISAGKNGREFYPTQIVRSGKGLYIKWIFDEYIHGGAIPRWKRVMSFLLEKFKDMGADPALSAPIEY